MKQLVTGTINKKPGCVFLVELKSPVGKVIIRYITIIRGEQQTSKLLSKSRSTEAKLSTKTSFFFIT